MGETDTSGLGLLREAHLRLDWAADGLDLTSSTIGSSYPYRHTHSPARHLSLHTRLFPTKLLTLSVHRPYLGLTAPTKDLSSCRYHPPTHTASHPRTRPQCPGSRSSPSIVHTFPSMHSLEGPLREGPGPNSQWLRTKMSKT